MTKQWLKRASHRASLLEHFRDGLEGFEHMNGNPAMLDLLRVLIDDLRGAEVILVPGNPVDDFFKHTLLETIGSFTKSVKERRVLLAGILVMAARSISRSFDRELELIELGQEKEPAEPSPAPAG